MLQKDEDINDGNELALHLKNFKYTLEKETNDLSNLKIQLEGFMGESKGLALEIIDRIFVDKKRNIVFLDSIIDKEKQSQYHLEAAIERFRLMDEFRLCTVEAQAATEDIREEINRVISTLNIQQQKVGEQLKKNQLYSISFSKLQFSAWRVDKNCQRFIHIFGNRSRIRR